MEYIIDPQKTFKFRNNADYCIGSGRMGLTLQKRFVEQLRLVQERIGFKHIRCHGLFSDDMAIYNEYTDDDGNVRAEYNFTYLDLVMDSYKELGLKPFIELGFMPKLLGSGEQTVFYWKSNVTPPKSYKKWRELVKATLAHLAERYGNEVYEYPVEVWNEPNLAGFWKDADMEEYFRLYKETAQAVKEAGPFRVGGPAICGVNDEEWMQKFLEFVRKEKAPLDFVTRHHYTVEAPDTRGHYCYQKLHELDYSMQTLENTRRIIDSFDEFRGMEVHLTEFNTSYDPKCVLHDTNRNAAYIAALISRMSDNHASYSYWTAGDIFEEQGVPFTPFHGGFGLVNNNLILKPTFYTFEFYKKLTGKCVHRSDNAVVTYDKGKYRGTAWNIDDDTEIEFSFADMAGRECCVITETVDEECCNPLKLWHDMGEKSSLSPYEEQLIRESAKPLIRSQHISDGKVRLNLKKNAVVYFELYPSRIRPDRGYDYERVIKGE